MTNLLEHYHITLTKEALCSKHCRVLCSRESVVEDAGESEGTAFKPWQQESVIVLAKHFPLSHKEELHLKHNFLFGMCKPQMISVIHLEIFKYTMSCGTNR